jgi:hypothetical protein
MYFHFAILIFFRPFRNQNIAESTTSPRRICSEAAENLFTLIKSYRDLYTLRRVPSFVPYMILTANLAYLVDLTDDDDDDEQPNPSHSDLASLSYLQDMCTSHDFAERALDIVDYFSNMWGVRTRSGSSGVDILRERLRQASGGGSGSSHPHPARDITSTETFFLPASPAEPAGSSGGGYVESGGGGGGGGGTGEAQQKKNSISAGMVGKLFPQQARRVGGFGDEPSSGREGGEHAESEVDDSRGGDVDEMDVSK